MKHKQFPLILALALLLSSCSSNSSDWSNKVTGSSGSSSGGYSMSEAEVYNMESFDAGSSMSQSTQLSNSSALENVKLVYTGNLSIESKDFTASTEEIWSLVEEMGGYFSSHQEERYGSFHVMYYTIRIPSEKYYTFLELVGDSNHVTSSSTEVEDISMEYYDSQGRLETQELKMARLQAMIEQAETMEDLITLESAISETQWMIDNLSGKMKQYDSLVDYATITMTLREVQELSSIEAAPTTFFHRIGDSFERGTSDFFQTVENLVVRLAYNWIGTLIFLAVGYVFFLKWKRGNGSLSQWKVQRKLQKQEKKQNKSQE